MTTQQTKAFDQDDLTDPTVRAFHGLPSQKHAPTPAGDLSYQETIDLLLLAAEAGQSVTIGHKQARAAGYAMKLAQEDAQPEAPTPSPELTARMVAFIYSCVAKDDENWNNFDPIEYESGPLFVEARAIAAELEPVDPDRIEARKIARAAHAQYEHDSLNEELLVIAIRRGRALAEAGK